MNLKGYVQVWDQDGCLVAEGPNLVVGAGKALMASLLAQESIAFPSHVAIGSNGTQADEGQTALVGTEHQRVEITSQSALQNEWTISATIPASGRIANVAVAEFGIFNAAVGGVMLARFIINGVTLQPTGSFILKWTLTVG